MAAAPSYVWFNGAPRWYYGANTGTAVTMPVDTVEYGTAWGGTWADGAKTQGDPEFSPGFENRDLETDQDDGAIFAWRTANSLTFKIPMLDSTVAMMKRAHGQGTVTTGVAETQLAVGGDTPVIDFYSIGFEGYAPGGALATPKYRRLYIPMCTPTDIETLAFKRKEETVCVVTFKAYVDTNQTAGKRLWWLIDDLD